MRIFENEFRDHIVIQRQGGYHKLYDAQLNTVTWYTGPGILWSKQNFGEATMYELIANTPVDDGVTQAWHAVLLFGGGMPADVAQAAQIEAQAGALAAFSADFNVWANKKPAIRVLQLKHDGPFNMVRKWYKQFFDSRESLSKHHQEVNGLYHIENFAKPGADTVKLEESIESLA